MRDYTNIGGRQHVDISPPQAQSCRDIVEQVTRRELVDDVIVS
jgi:hypothetical protein